MKKNNFDKWKISYRKSRAKKDRIIRKVARVGVVVYIVGLVLMFLQ